MEGADEDPLEEDEDDELLPAEEDLLCEEVVPLDPEELLAWEYESAGNATMARATIDAIAMLRMFFISMEF